MAGDWIKLRLDLRSDPAVFKLASITKLDRFSIVGRLAEFWGWADKHAVDGVVDGATSTVVDDVVCLPGFAEALVLVDWLRIHADSIEIPRHERHNGESAKERGLKNARQARWRLNKGGSVDAQPSTKASTREEKRRVKGAKAPKSPAKLPTCPVEQIVEAYNEILPEMVGVRVLDDERVKLVKERWDWVLTTTKPDGTRRAETAEQAQEWFRNYFERARNNDFLMGKTPRVNGHKDWKCDIDFLMTSKGLKQVIEKTEAAA